MGYKVSLVVPIYGVEKYIGRFAESALSQTCTDMQFVFVNDGTPDRSMEILNSLIEEKYSWRKSDIVIVNKNNEGLPLARKTGVENADGEYILFADSDDWLEKDAVQKVVDRIESTGADMVYFDLIKEYADHQSYKREKEYTERTKRDFIINIFNYRSQGYTVTKCFRKSLYTDNVIYTPIGGMHEDIYLMSQIIFYAGSFSHIGEGLYHYRKDNAGAMCSQSRKDRHIASSKNLLDLYIHYRDHLKGSPIEDVYAGILLRAGWHAMIHKYDFWTECPFLAKDIKKCRISGRYLLNIFSQIIVKIYVIFR